MQCDRLSYQYEKSLFQEIKWNTDTDAGDRCRLPKQKDPLYEIVPRVLFSGFIESIVEINLMWMIKFENENGENSVMITVKQDMDEMDPQPLAHEKRYKVSRNKPPYIEIE